MSTAVRGVRWAVRVAIGVVVLGLVLPYALLPVFRYPPPTPFAGRSWYDPYAGMHGAWHQMSLHDHGLTCCLPASERRSDEEMAAYYRALGYDVATVADHQRFSYLPGPRMYEHGANVLKTHQLVIGARSVDWLDFPLLQSTDDKQYVLGRLRADSALVGLAHPGIRNGYSFDDLRRLTGYDFMEVLHEDVSYERYWDTALSAGRLSWATGSDDAHGTGRPSKMGLAWTMLRAGSTDAGALVGALRAGWSYAVLGQRGVNDVELRNVTIRGDTLVVSTDPGALSFTFIGQGGRVRSVVHASSRASYLLRPGDSYIRTVVRTPRSALYLNPVVRTEGGRPVAVAAAPALAATWGLRLALLCALLAFTWALRRRPVRGVSAGRSSTRARSRRSPRRVAA